jgi:hypothetical protein
MHNKVDKNGQLKNQYESPYLIYFERNEIGLQIKKFKWRWNKRYFYMSKFNSP